MAAKLRSVPTLWGEFPVSQGQSSGKQSLKLGEKIAISGWALISSPKYPTIESRVRINREVKIGVNPFSLFRFFRKGGASENLGRSPVRVLLKVALQVRRYRRYEFPLDVLLDHSDKTRSRDDHQVGNRFQATSRQRPYSTPLRILHSLLIQI